MSAVLTADESSSAKTRNAVGFALILEALALPFLALWVGVGTAFQAGEAIPLTLVILAFLGLVSWLITRKASALARANARVAIGVLLSIWMGTNSTASGLPSG